MKKPKVVKPIVSRRRNTGTLESVPVRRWGGSIANPLQYDYIPGSAPRAGMMMEMSDFTGTFRKFSAANPQFSEKPMSSVRVEWAPYSASNYTHMNNVASPNTGVNHNTGPVLSAIFGPLLYSGLAAESAVCWSNIPTVTDATANQRNVAITNEVWKNVDVSQASTLVSLAESHKSLKLLNSKGRALVALIDAAKQGKTTFLRVLSKSTGIDVRKQPMPKRYLVWDPVNGVPIHNGKGKTFARYGRYRWESTTDLVGTASQLLLEYRYGWKIMVMEIVDQLKAFYAEDLRGELLLKYSRDYQVSRVRKSFTDVSTRQVSGVIGGMTHQGTVTTNCTTEVHAWVRYKLKSDPLFRRLNDYGIFDITRSLYDVIPYSFVLDMLVDVSGYLQAVDAYLKANVLSSGHSIKSTYTVVRTWNSSNASSFGWTSDVPSGARDDLKIVQRSRKGYLGFPRNPTVNVKLGVYNLATLGALLKTGAESARSLRV